MSEKVYCITICENQFDDVNVHKFDSKEEMEGFKRGFCEGAGQYGAGSACAWSVQDLEYLREDNEYDAFM